MTRLSAKSVPDNKQITNSFLQSNIAIEKELQITRGQEEDLQQQIDVQVGGRLCMFRNEWKKITYPTMLSGI